MSTRSDDPSHCRSLQRHWVLVIRKPLRPIWLLCVTLWYGSLPNPGERLSFLATRGDGTTSSSDGQRFPVGGPRGNTAQINAKYGPEPGLVFYTHIYG